MYSSSRPAVRSPARSPARSKSPRRIASPRQTIVDIAVGNPDFSTLVNLLKKANLVGALEKERT